ncbi:putative leucine-rich repeat receptor-like protein kinase [Hibiscus syriacus]|uniref:Leucine-rich repeat receptor-like protein kinase n=1 Tax=Hibiscus syriacus TaxID=106335 RepID=A0A6A3AKS3_HIBSY|nr:putative leucine-rich repeat receptor-like protein kinase [Hibiscus syriacus]
MAMIRDIVLVLASSFALAIVVIHAQDQSGFISLDCGSPEGTRYTEATTGINYISDDAYTQTGVSRRVLPEFSTNMQRQMVYLRSFPEGERNCYNLTLRKGDRYLIRASFMYGNYDQRNEIPEFDLYLGPSLWANVILRFASPDLSWELIHALQSNYLHICLVNTGKGTPFISALELRLLKNTTYTAGSMAFLQRFDICSTGTRVFRYSQDIYDRAWSPYQTTDWTQIATSSDIRNGLNDYQPPLLAMRSACTPANASQPLNFPINSSIPNAQYYIYMHFAEIQELEANQSREFNIYINGNYWGGPYSPTYLSADTLYSPAALRDGEISLVRTTNSTLPPILNAIEMYTVKELVLLQTVDTEGGIPRYIQNLTRLQHLDLSNNSLTGPVPEFLRDLHSLTVLNLNDNNLNGSVPAELVERSRNGLTLSVEGNPNLCAKASCVKKKKNNTVVPVVASVVSVAVLATVVAILWRIRKRKSLGKKDVDSKSTAYQSMVPKDMLFNYSEVSRMTNNFERVLGKGGFGTVYHGSFNGTQVAVKMLSESSAQGYKQFHAEVELLLRVHHRNLTPLIGYCDDGTNLGLIYEFMAKGNLSEHLSGNSSGVLSWEQRLSIALEAAQGLEYLHNGCKPPIVHRDVKCTNILLTENLQAKLSDFGLSKSFPTEGSETHVSTVVAGTPGYLDPEYSATNRLTEKSDVYSFGVVLLEIITGRPVIDIRSRDEATHIKQWVGSMLSNGDIKNIVDPRLRGDFDVSSAWKVVEIAMACLSRASIKRPTMIYVVTELAECLSSEIGRTTRSGHENEPGKSIGMATMESGSDSSPLAR